MITIKVKNKMRTNICKNRSVIPTLLTIAIAQVLMSVPLTVQAAEEAQAEMRVLGRSTIVPSKGYTVDYSTASTGMALSLRETPQSVSVITQQRMQDQGLKTLDDIMTNATGVSLTQYDNFGRITYRARGFSISNFKTDGLNVNFASDYGTNANMGLYDHVDIIRGANGLLGGTGDPSATVNMIRKQPNKKPAANLGIIYGRWDKRQMSADINTPLAFDGRIRSRFVISAEDSGSYLDRAGVRNVDALANFEVDITDSTLLNFGAQYDYNHTKGTSWGSNVPIWYYDGSRTNLPRSTNFVPNWAHRDLTSATFFASIEQHFADNWKTKLSYSHNHISSIKHSGTVKVNRGAAPGTWASFLNQNDGTGGYLNAIYSDGYSKEDDLAWTINGIFHLFGRNHELMGGINGYRIENTSYIFDENNCGIFGKNGRYKSYGKNSCMYRSNSIEILPDWRTWDGTIEGFTAYRTNARSVNITTNYGGYIAGRFNLADPLNIVLGTRLSNYSYRKDSYNKTNQVKIGNTSSNNGVVTPYAGVIFDVNESNSVYASYTSVFKPQENKEDREGKQIKPATGDSYEAGLKSEFFGGRLNTSATLFLAQKNNLARQLKGVTTPTGAQAYTASERGVRSQGVELDISGAITDSWNVYFGYTYLKVNNPNVDADMDDPHHIMRLFTTYQLPGSLNGLTVGTGIRAQSYTSATAFPGRPKVAGTILSGQDLDDNIVLKNSGYALVDLMARYQFNKNVSLTVNVNNLFDKTYTRNIGFYDGLIYGEPRSYWATLNISY